MSSSTCASTALCAIVLRLTVRDEMWFRAVQQLDSTQLFFKSQSKQQVLCLLLLNQCRYEAQVEYSSRTSHLSSALLFLAFHFQSIPTRYSMPFPDY